jgi:hypothetical protein
MKIALRTELWTESSKTSTSVIKNYLGDILVPGQGDAWVAAGSFDCKVIRPCRGNKSAARKFGGFTTRTVDALMGGGDDHLCYHWQGTVLAVESIELYRKFRGQGMGLVVMDHLIETIGWDVTNVAIEPGPIEKHGDTQVARERLAQYWGLLGFTHHSGNLFTLHRSTCSINMNKVLSNYHERLKNAA